MSGARGELVSPAPSLEEQLRNAYEMVDELHDMEVRLRTAIETVLTTFKGESE